MISEEKYISCVTLYLDGELIPLSLAKSIIDSDLLKGKDFREFVDYLSVHVKHHCQHGLTNTEE